MALSLPYHLVCVPLDDVATTAIPQRVGIGSQDAQSIEKELQLPGDRYGFNLAKTRHKLEARPICHSSGCLPDTLEDNPRRLCLPSFLYDRLMSQGDGRAGFYLIGGTSLAISALVSNSPGLSY